MTELYQTLQQAFAQAGLPCSRGEGAPEGRVPCLRWSLQLTEPDKGMVTLTCWYQGNDGALLTRLDLLCGLFPARGRLLRAGEGRLVLLRPCGVDVIRDSNVPGLRGGRLRLSLKTWSDLEVMS